MHVRFRGDRLSVIENGWLDRASMILCYFILGPLFGIRQQIEPDIKPNKRLAFILVLNLAFLYWSAPMLLRLGLAWTLVTPAVLYVCYSMPEVVYEHRNYVALLGIATLAAWSAERAPLLVAGLAVLYAVRTIQRNRRLRTAFGYWKLAYQESPNHWRVRFNYAQQLQINGKELDALPLLHSLFDAPRPCGETAAQHASVIYLKHQRLEDAEKLLGSRGEAILKFPNNRVLRILRSDMLRSQGKAEQADLALQAAKALA